MTLKHLDAEFLFYFRKIARLNERLINTNEKLASCFQERIRNKCFDKMKHDKKRGIEIIFHIARACVMDHFIEISFYKFIFENTILFARFDS